MTTFSHNWTEMRCLDSLMLAHTTITDAGLIHVRNLTNLNIVYISGNGITDAGMAHLGVLTNLSASSPSRAPRSPTPGWSI